MLPFGHSPARDPYVPDKRIVLVGGGVRCGKSAFALARAQQLGERRAFIATGQAIDDEMRERIRLHQAERDVTFETHEAPTHVREALEACAGHDVVVIDCLTLWLSNLLGAQASDAEIGDAVARLAEAVYSSPASVVMVTNEVGLGIVPPTPLGRRFRDLAGRTHQRLVALADEVYFGALGAMLRLRPGPVTLQGPSATPFSETP